MLIDDIVYVINKEKYMKQIILLVATSLLVMSCSTHSVSKRSSTNQAFEIHNTNNRDR